MWRYGLPLVVLLLLVGFFWRGLYLDPGKIPSPLIGKPAPAFSLPSLEYPARSVSLTDLRGQVVLVNVWGTWCVECIREHPVLLAFAKNTDVPVYGLNSNDQRDAALAWLAERGNPYVINAFDASGKVSIDWGVYGAPETFVLDKAAIIRYKHIGPLTPEVLYGEIMPLVKQLRAAP